MTLDLLAAHPTLVTRLDPDAGRRCHALVRNYGRDTYRWCSRLARFTVTGHSGPQCGQHAAQTLRRHLQASEGGDR